MSGRRAVICDFGGVLTTPLLDAFAAFHERSGIPAERLGEAMARAGERFAGDHPLFALERGEMTEADFLRTLEAELGDGATLAGMRDTLFEHLHPNERMLDYMRELAGRGLRMALLTNNVREWEPQWRAKMPDVDRVFEVVVDSAFVGMRKPDPRIYLLTLERLGGDVAPADCVFVDDLEPNCEAARGLGMHAVRFEETGRAIAEIEDALG